MRLALMNKIATGIGGVSDDGAEEMALDAAEAHGATLEELVYIQFVMNQFTALPVEIPLRVQEKAVRFVSRMIKSTKFIKPCLGRK